MCIRDRTKTASTSPIDLLALWTSLSPNKWCGLWIPGVSTKIIWDFSFVSITFNRFLVVWAIGDVIAIFSPINLFMKVDLPTLGLPINAINPDLKSSWFKSHKDISFSTIIYSLTIKVQ